MPVRLAQTAFVGGELGPQLIGRQDLEKYGYCLRTAKNALPTRYGSIFNRPGTKFIGEVRDSSKTTRVVPFTFSTTQNYVGEIGDEVWRPIMDQGQILITATNITACTTASPAVFTSNSHGGSNGERVYLSGINGLALNGVTQVNDRVMILANVAANTFELTDLFGNAFNSTGLTAYSSGGTVSRLYQLTLPWDHLEVFDLGYAQTADTMYFTHLSYAVRKLTRTGHAAWSINSVTFGSGQAAPTNPAVNASPASGATQNHYKITAFDEDTQQESLPTASVTATNDLTVAGNRNTVSWTAASGADRYHVYKDSGTGVFGFIGGTTSTSFVDGLNGPISEDLGDTPPSNRDPFSSTDNRPGVCGFHEGRLLFGRTNNTPGGVWTSQSNKYENLNVSSPAKADDAMSFNFRPGVNAVTGFASLAKLGVFTLDREWIVDGAGVTGYLTPASLVTRAHSKRGSAELMPLEVSDIALFAGRQATRVFAFGYSYEKDSYVPNDLTLLAPHLFDGYTIVDWCYQQDPHSVVWIVRSDGALISLTFVPEQNVYAFARHYLGGSFSTTEYGIVESCACIEGTTEDEVYLVVKRTINSVTKRYIEMLAPRWNGDTTALSSAYFVDCGRTITNSPASATVSGLWHLEGQTVGGLADGSVFTGKVVSGGQITIDFAATTIQVGLLYTTDMEPLPVAQGSERGAIQGRRKIVNAVVLKLRHTLGIKIGDINKTDLLVELKPDHVDGWDSEDPITGDTLPIRVDGEWDMDAVVLIRQEVPLPCEILAQYSDITVGG